NTFHFQQFGPLPAFVDGTPIEIRLGGWSDTGSNAAAARTLGTLVLDTPTATLATPASGAAVGTAELPSIAVSVLFTPVSAQTVHTIAASLVSLRQGGIVRAATGVTRSGNLFTFTFSSTAGLAPGTVFVDVAGWQDGAGNTAAAATLGSFVLENAQ